MSTRPRLVALLAGLAVIGIALGGAVALGPAAPASAHDYIVSTEPAIHSTGQKNVTKVVMTFDDVVLNLGGTQHSTTLVEVTDAAGRHFETGCASTADRVVTVPVALGAGGLYTVTYQLVSADGHTVSNTWTFTADSPAAGSSVPAGTASSACAEDRGLTPTDVKEIGKAPTSTSTNAANLDTPSTGSSANLGLVIGIAGAIVGLGVVGVVVLLVTSRRRKPPTDSA